MKRKLLALFSLKFNPFSPEVPVSALLVSPALENFCRRLQNQLAEGGFALVSGAPGTGKSATLRVLTHQLGELQDVAVAILTRPQASVADFYRELGSLFAVPLTPHNRWSGAKALRDKWQAHIEASLYRPVLIIDEAQEMKTDVLRELRILAGTNLDSRAILSVVLAGDSRLAQRLHDPDLKCSVTDAARLLHGWLDSPCATTTLDVPSRRPEPPRPNVFRPFRRCIPLQPRVPFLQHRKGIRVDTALRFEAGLADPASTFLRATVAGRLHDLDGRPIGYCGRRIETQQIERWGKWRFPARFPKAQVLYNAHRALAQRPRGIVLVECPWAVMRLTQTGVPGVVALLGTPLGPIQSAWPAAAPTVLLLLDGDPAGYAATTKISRTLAKHTTVAAHRLAPGQEPEDLSDPEPANLVRRVLPFSLNPPL